MFLKCKAKYYENWTRIIVMKTENTNKNKKMAYMQIKIENENIKKDNS